MNFSLVAALTHEPTSALGASMLRPLRPATRAAQIIGGRGVRLSLLIASLVLGLVIQAEAPLVGRRVGGIEWPADTSLVAILREGRVLVPHSDDPLQAGDELFFVTSEDVEDDLARLLSANESR